MATSLRSWGVRGLGAVLVFVLLALGVLYGGSHLILTRRYPVEPQRLPPADPGSVARGARLATITGCTSCHGKDLRGQPFQDIPYVGMSFAHNLTLKAKGYSDADLARIIRQGVKPDGRGVVAMPSSGYTTLTDADAAAIIAYIRTLPAGGAEQPPPQFAPLGRFKLLTGDLKPDVVYVREAKAMTLADPGPAFARGRYLASIACAECHNPDLKGQDGWTPDLAIVGSYDRADFHRLMRTGKAAGNRELGMMSGVARYRFSILEKDEINGLYDYLQARAAAAR